MFVSKPFKLVIVLVDVEYGGTDVLSYYQEGKYCHIKISED